ncbi:MAG: HAMP domain-containing protein [Thaumarchaeota archaeon]|nr:HAMP domain-containing protein [Nitrososphaerota archaeon]
MRVQRKILLGFLIIIAITIPNGIVGFLKVEQNLLSIESNTKSNINYLKVASHFDSLAVLMRYYDEVLTQAARNYAFTSDEKWAATYFESEPKLDQAIQDALATGSEKEKSIFSKINDTNILLVKLEHQAITLVKEGNAEDAIKILESSEYWDSKRVYRQALIQYSEAKGIAFDQIIDMSATKVDDYTSKINSLLLEIQIILYIGIPILVIIAVGLSYFISHSISKPIRQLHNAAEQVSRGDYNVRFQAQKNDEIGELGQKFQSMIDAFKNSLETERKLAVTQERLKTEKLAAIGELAARIAHDLRNPLSVIKNVSELIRIQYPKDDPRLQDHFNKLENSVQRMSHQIDDVLNFVRSTPLEKKITSLREIIQKSVDDLDVPTDITIIMPSNDEKIDCDDQKLRTAFSNILLNAIQAMPDKGTISIKITGYTKHVSVDVSDSGPGIPENVLPHIFEPLFTTKQRGTGLGLSSCKNIIEQHGGTILAKNNPTTFVITLPRI